LKKINLLCLNGIWNSTLNTISSKYPIFFENSLWTIDFSIKTISSSFFLIACQWIMSITMPLDNDGRCHWPNFDICFLLFITWLNTKFVIIRVRCIAKLEPWLLYSFYLVFDPLTIIWRCNFKWATIGEKFVRKQS